MYDGNPGYVLGLSGLGFELTIISQLYVYFPL